MEILSIGRSARCEARRSEERAFTFLELLVVIAVLVVLAALIVPAMALSRADSGAAKCMSNHRELATAWQMYANINRNLFPPNGNGTGMVDGGTTPTWCEGWLEWNANWPDNTNWHQLIDTTAPNGTSASLAACRA